MLEHKLPSQTPKGRVAVIFQGKLLQREKRIRTKDNFRLGKHNLFI